MAVTWLQLKWLHDVSEAALAVAVVVLGVVILMELRSLRAMKHALDSHLARVFEQLDLLRFEHSPQPDRQESGVEPGAVPVAAPVAMAPGVMAPSTGNPYSAAAALAASGSSPEEIARRCGLAAGEARLLASLAAARSAGLRDAS